MRGISADDTLPLLRDALTETGAVGVTARQLATRVAHPLPSVRGLLDQLERDGEVVRMGRGLYVLRDYEELREDEGFAGPEGYEERFEDENGIVLGEYRGPITFSANDGLPVHRWWSYVQGYSAGFVRRTLEESDLPEGARVLDPFAGSGTTLVEARLLGFAPVGSELLPPAALAARVKTHFELDPGRLRDEQRRLLLRARGASGASIPFLRETRRQFTPRNLRALARLRTALPPDSSAEARAARLAFGRILIPTSRLHRSPCLGYGRRTGSAEPFAALREAAREMEEDLGWLREQRDRWGPPASVLVEDARTARWPPQSVAFALTSPPYVNGMDYVMNYKLDLAWMGYARSYRDLADLRQSLVSCDNLPRSEASRFLATDRAPDPWLPDILERIHTNVDRKGSYRRGDVHGIVNRYFLDLVPVLKSVYHALRPGGQFVLVVGDSLLAGVYVPGDLLLARLGEGCGFRIESVQRARTRRSGQRRTFRLRESIITLERPQAAT